MTSSFNGFEGDSRGNVLVLVTKRLGLVVCLEDGDELGVVISIGEGIGAEVVASVGFVVSTVVIGSVVGIGIVLPVVID